MTHEPYILNAIAGGYRFECSCGELYKSVESAQACRKCRTYAEHNRCTAVYDVSQREFAWEAPVVTPTPERKVAQTFTFADALSATDLQKLRDSLPN